MTGHDIIEIGIPKGPAIGLALVVATKLADEGVGDGKILSHIRDIANRPGFFVENSDWPPEKELAKHLYQKELDEQLRASSAPRDSPLPHTVFGAELIDEGTHQQMHDSMRLPITVAGALMPDAHVAYGLPVGGVLATEDAVIPYAVGVDIACRMMLSIFSTKDPDFNERDHLSRALQRETSFGAGKGFDDKRQHAIMDDERWDALPLFRKLKNKAHFQLGSSGGGNHFCEWGRLELASPIKGRYGTIQPGNYLALMSHSGSRAFGYAIAKHYTDIAMSTCYGLPKELERLAWLDMKSSAGQEYWLAMNFAGDYASACHHLIHEHVARAAGVKPIMSIENHHNFAWKESHWIGGEEREVIVHRKGATPAGKGVLGIIPGSMAAPGYVVCGTGSEASLTSASHGAGRQMGRAHAKREIDPEEARRAVELAGITLLGGGLDEAPQAYKPIDEVIRLQVYQDLIETVGKFFPKIVMMADDSSPI